MPARSTRLILLAISEEVVLQEPEDEIDLNNSIIWNNVFICFPHRHPPNQDDNIF